MQVRSLNRIGALALGYWRADGSMFDPTESLLRLLGCTRADVHNRKVLWTEITPSEYAPLDVRALEQIREFGESVPFEKELIGRGGQRIPVLVGGASFGDGVVNAGSFFVVDLTSSKRRHAPLNRREFVASGRLAELKERAGTLTLREREIADMLARGETCKQIARLLTIANKTVDCHRATILRKMSVDNPTQLAHLMALLK